MYQGNIALIHNRLTNEDRWVCKLRTAEQGVVYFDMSRQQPPIAEGDVDDKGSKPSKPWGVTYELTGEALLDSISFAAPNAEECKRRQPLYDLCKEIKVLESNAESLSSAVAAAKEHFESKAQAYHNTVIALDSLKQQYENATLNNTEPVFCYVYGIHDATNRTEYCWYADADVANRVKAGDIVRVDTARGQQLAVVTRVERSNKFKLHKRVIEVVTKDAADDDLAY